MSAIGMRKGLPKRTFYNKSNVYYLESGKGKPVIDGCNLGCCVFYPNHAECPTCCGCDTDLCISCSGLACAPCNLKKWELCIPRCVAKFPGCGSCDADCLGACVNVACRPCDVKVWCDVCVPMCLEKCPCLEPCSCCCDCAHPFVGFETEAKIGKFVVFEGYFCCDKNGSACTYMGKRDGKDVILLTNGTFVELNDAYKFAPGKPPVQQKMTKKKPGKDGKEEEEEEEEDGDGGDGDGGGVADFL